MTTSGKTSKIDSFKDDYSFLSNFYPVEIEFEDRVYSSVEHAYQAAKTTDKWWRNQVKNASAGQAKRIGRLLPIREDWENIKLDVMEKLVRQKFANNMELMFKLDQTYPAELIEGNWWGDTFWGVYKGEGKNHLGKILMKIRSEIE